MEIKNINIFCNDYCFRKGQVIFDNDTFREVNYKYLDYGFKDLSDADGLFLIPGLIDIHLHGCNNYDFCTDTKKALDNITNYQIKHGITSICPTTMTYPEKFLTEIMQNVKSYKNDHGSNVVGINMEGPFISINKLGAQNPKYIDSPNLDMLNRLQEASGGLIKLVDIAPELNGAIDFIKQASKKYKISIAHSNADYDISCKAYKCGATHLTHCFNAMQGIHHRFPGPIAAAYDSGANIEIICDGIHVSYPVIRMIFKLFGPKNICLISDSSEATGLEDGNYLLGGQSIKKSGSKVTLKNDPNVIAGSASNLMDCLKHAIFDAYIDFGIAIAAATINPASAIDIQNKYGSIEPGKYADFLIVDNKLNIIEVYKHGVRI